MDQPPSIILRPARAEADQGQRRVQVISRGAPESLLVLFVFLGSLDLEVVGARAGGFGLGLIMANVVTVRRLVYKRQISGRQLLLGISFSVQPCFKQVGRSLPKGLPLGFSSRVFLVPQSTTQQFPGENGTTPWVEEGRVLANQGGFKGQ